MIPYISGNCVRESSCLHIFIIIPRKYSYCSEKEILCFPFDWPAIVTLRLAVTSACYLAVTLGPSKNSLPTRLQGLTPLTPSQIRRPGVGDLEIKRLLLTVLRQAKPFVGFVSVCILHLTIGMYKSPSPAGGAGGGTRDRRKSVAGRGGKKSGPPSRAALQCRRF